MIHWEHESPYVHSSCESSRASRARSWTALFTSLYPLTCLKQQSTRPKMIHAEFDQPKCEALRAVLHQSPRVYGKKTSVWTLVLAVQVCQELGLTEQQVSIETIGLALKRLGVGWRRAKDWITSVRRVGAYEISASYGRGRE